MCFYVAKNTQKHIAFLYLYRINYPLSKYFFLRFVSSYTI